MTEYLKKAEEYVAICIAEEQLASLTGFCNHAGISVVKFKKWGSTKENVAAYENIIGTLIELIIQSPTKGITTHNHAQFLLKAEFGYGEEEIDENLVIKESELKDY